MGGWMVIERPHPERAFCVAALLVYPGVNTLLLCDDQSLVQGCHTSRRYVTSSPQHHHHIRSPTKLVLKLIGRNCEEATVTFDQSKMLPSSA
jgi:hypothetical protein